MLQQHQSGILKIVDMSEEKTSTDGRHYRTVYFQPVAPEGLLSNAPVRGRNIWEEGPNGSAGDPLYPNLTKSNGEPNIGAKVIGEVQSVETKPYYIPNEYGKFNDPETGEPANKVTQYSSVVFEGEDIVSLARQQGREIAGAEEFEELEQQETQQTVEEELAVEG